MGRIAIFTDDPGWHGARLTQAFAQRGYSSECVSLTDCRMTIGNGEIPIQIPGFGGCLPDGVFVRGVPGGSLEEVIFYLDILHGLKLLGVTVYNDGRAIEVSVDKGLTSFLLARAGIPTPPTWVVRDRQQALAIAEAELCRGYKVVTKPLFGSQGEGLRRFEKMTDLFWLTPAHGIFYMQRFIDCGEKPSFDWRVFVINGRSVAAMRRCGTSWLNNVARGAVCELAELDAELCQLAERALDALSMQYGGVDIIRDKQGDYSVIEVNSIPAWKGLQSVCRIDIADCLAADFLGRCGTGSNGGSAASWA